MITSVTAINQVADRIGRLSVRLAVSFHRVLKGYCAVDFKVANNQRCIRPRRNDGQNLTINEEYPITNVFLIIRRLFFPSLFNGTSLCSPANSRDQLSNVASYPAFNSRQHSNGRYRCASVHANTPSPIDEWALFVGELVQ